MQVGPFHTNTKAGLELAQRILERAALSVGAVQDGELAQLPLFERLPRANLIENHVGFWFFGTFPSAIIGSEKTTRISFA